MTLSELFKIVTIEDSRTETACYDRSEALVYMDVQTQEYREEAHKIRKEKERLNQ